VALGRITLLGFAALAISAAETCVAEAQVAEVVVTARKRNENVQNVPVAVTTIAEKQIQAFNLSNVEDLAQATPQLFIARGSSGSGADITLRGIGSSLENIGIEQSVAVNIDGVYYGQGRAIDEGVFDVSSVEVLKGPQALFYGKNATAGAIAIQTHDPASQPEAYLTTGYEFTARQPYLQGVLSGPVTDDIGLRLAFQFSDAQSGYLRQTARPGGLYATRDAATGDVSASPTADPSAFLGGDKNALIRATAKWTPAKDLTATLKATFDQHDANNNADNTVNIYCPLGYPQSEVGLSYHTTCGRSFQAPQPGLPLEIANTPGSLEGKAGGRDFESYVDGNLYLKLDYVGSGFTATSTSGYQRLTNDWADNQNFSAATSVYGGEHFDWEQFSTEARAISTFKFPLNFAGGVYFQTTSLNFQQDVDFAAAQNTAAAPIDQFVAYNKRSGTIGHTYAVFGQVIWDIAPGVELTAGARYTHELKASFFEQPYVNPTLSALFVPYDPSNPATSVVAHQVFDNASPEAALTWKPTRTLTLYAAYKTAYKSGGFSDSAILSSLTLPSDLQFKPEVAKGFEIGLKSTWLDRQLRVNVEVFDFLYSNLQVDFFNTPTFNYVTLNAASARTYGLELQADYAPKTAPGLTLNFDGAYDDAHYDQFEAPCSPAGLTYDEGCDARRLSEANGGYSFSPACGGGAAPNCDFMNVSGRPTASAPKWTGLIGGDYERNIAPHLKADLSIHARLSSSYLLSPFPSGVAEQIDSQGAYATFDAALSVGSPDRRWSLSLIGRNLTNAFVATSSAGLPLSGGLSGCKVAVCGPQLVSDQSVTVENPRTVTLQLTVSF
jgi:outer membrane receptor protein involved in Fe transport